MAVEKITAAPVGTEFKLAGRKVVVGPKCLLRVGSWLCVTHPDDQPMRQYRNQFQKDIHVSDGAVHVLAWDCAEHGPETP